jgi:hypothetical protein|tara:strand:+ start:797 stop:1138 length:342 start_codon:yes stop_codon:yes gene_type:complete
MFGKNSMAQRENKSEVITEYIDLLYLELKTRFGEEPQIKDMLAHLIERGMVEPKRLRNYMVIKDFDNLLVTNDGNRTHSFIDLSIKYDITERTAQNIVYKERDKSKIIKNVRW